MDQQQKCTRCEETFPKEKIMAVSSGGKVVRYECLDETGCRERLRQRIAKRSDTGDIFDVITFFEASSDEM